MARSKFRTVHSGKDNDRRDNEHYMGEPTIPRKDMWHKGFGRIAVVLGTEPPSAVECVPNYQGTGMGVMGSGIKRGQK